MITLYPTECFDFVMMICDCIAGTSEGVPIFCCQASLENRKYVNTLSITVANSSWRLCNKLHIHEWILYIVIYFYICFVVTQGSARVAGGDLGTVLVFS